MVKKKTTVAPSKQVSASTGSVQDLGISAANVNASKPTNTVSPLISYGSTNLGGERDVTENASSKAHQMHQAKQQLQQQQHSMQHHLDCRPQDIPDPCDLFNSYEAADTCAVHLRESADEPTCGHDHNHNHNHNHNHGHSHNHNHSHNQNHRLQSHQHTNYDDISVQLATASFKESFTNVATAKRPPGAAAPATAAGNKSQSAPKLKMVMAPPAAGLIPPALSRKLSMSPPELTNSSSSAAKKSGLNFDEDQLSRFEQMFFDLLTRPSNKEAVGAGAGSGSAHRTSNSFVPRKQQQHRKISREMASMRKKGNDNPGCICAQCHSNRVTGGARFARAAAAAAAASGNTNISNGASFNANRNSRSNSKLKNNPALPPPLASSNGPKHRPPQDEDVLDYYDEDYYSDDAYFDEEILTDDEDGMDPDSASYSVDDDDEDEMGPPVSDFEMVCFAMMGKVDVEDVLMELRCDSDVGNGNTPLHLAAVFGNLDAAKLIVEKYGGKHLIWEKNWNGETPVFLARDFRNEEVFKYLSDISDAGVDAYIMELDQEEERERKAKEKKKLKKQRQKQKKKGKKGDGEVDADGDGDHDVDDDVIETKPTESASKANGVEPQKPLDIKDVASATSSAQESVPTGTKNKASNDNNPLTDISNGSNKKSKKTKAKAKSVPGSLPGNGTAEQTAGSVAAPAALAVKPVSVQRGTPGLMVEHPLATNGVNNRSNSGNRVSSAGTSMPPPIELPTVTLPPHTMEQHPQVPTILPVVKTVATQTSSAVAEALPLAPTAAAYSKRKQPSLQGQAQSEHPMLSSPPVDLFPVLDKLSDEDDDDMPSFEEMLRELKASNIDFSDALL